MVLCFDVYRRPISRLYYGPDHLSLICSSYDRTMKRMDLEAMKFETIFKLPTNVDSDILIHHSVPFPDSKTVFYISLSNGFFFLFL